MALTGSCERCRARDGRATKEYLIVAKRGRRELCAGCAQATEAVFELKPHAPVAAAEDSGEVLEAEPKGRRWRRVTDEGSDQEE